MATVGVKGLIHRPQTYRDYESRVAELHYKTKTCTHVIFTEEKE